MSKLKVSEIFGPAGYWNYNVQEDGTHVPEFVERWGVTQGEGKFIGVPSVFVRTFSCNLRCPSYGLHQGQVTDEPEQIAKQLHLYKNLSELPAAEFGCDSFFSVYPAFKGMSPMLDLDVVADQCIQAAGGQFGNTHLIFTGGEPMLPAWQKTYNRLVRLILDKDSSFKKLNVTIETNGTQPVKSEEIHALANTVNLTWSISPKLSASGHTNEEAIFPEVIREYVNISNDAYLKFVVTSVDDFPELDSVVQRIRRLGVDIPIYCMPEGGSPKEYRKHATLDLIGEAVKRGYRVSPRLQVIMGDNLTGW